MLFKTALCDCVPLQINSGTNSIGMIRTASNKVLIEPNSEKAKIVEAEIKKHPNALFFRAKAIEANIPNTNGDYFSEEELFRAYKTFEGVPFFTNHDNQNIENAKGKIIFAEWIPEEKAVYTIAFVDRDAYPHISRSIEEEYITGVSMGCSVEYSVCNICGNKAEKTDDYCTHIRNRKGRKFSGKATNVVTGAIKDFKDELVYEYNYGIKFIELSAVVDPACPSCHIQGIIPNDDYLKRVANIQNSLYMIRTAAIEKQAGQEEIQQLEQVLKTLEDLAIKLIQQRKQVEPEFASDLVQIITDLQSWTDELTAAGYGSFQGGVPGTVGNLPEGEAPAPGALPGAAPAGGVLPAAGEAPMAEPTPAVGGAPVGQMSGAPGKPLVSGPNLPISAPVRPKANSSQSIQRISDYVIDRMKHGEQILNKFANVMAKVEKIGEEDMAKRRTISTKIADKEKTIEILSNSWKEKQEFSEYIKEVPSIQDNDIRLSVKKQDDTFIIVAENRDNPVVSKVWTYDDLNDEQKEMIRQNPQGAAVELLESFANSINNYKEGVKNMTDINREAGASSVQKTPEVITQRQLEDNKGLYHGRTGVEQEVVTQKQLDSKREGNEQDVVTQKQLDAKRTGTEAEVVTQKQLDSNGGPSPRTGNEAEVVTQKQLDSKRTGNEPDVVTQKQLDSVDAPWARQASRDPSKFKSAGDHMTGVINVMADAVLASGCTPFEACGVASSLVDSAKSRYDLSQNILSKPQDSNVDVASRLAYWRNKNFKIASAGTAEIADLIVNGLRKLASDATINPDVVISAVDVIGEGQTAVPSIAKAVDQKLSEAAETFKSKKTSVKDELRQALASASEETTFDEREKERVNLLASITSKSTRTAERAQWEKKLANKADTMIETTFQESGLDKKDPNFKKSIVSFARGALASQNMKLASITNVTISGNTIQIAVQTDDGEQSVEIPLGEATGPSAGEIMPEGDLGGEGLENAAPPAGPEAMSPTASSKNMKKVAQVPAGGGMPGAPGGVAAPGAPEAGGLPGGAPSNDPIQALTTGDEALPPEGEADEIPSTSDRQMPWAICPECGSSDVDVTQEETGGVTGQCKNPDCGAKYEALIKKNVEFTIINPKKGTEGAGAGGPPPEAPEVPEVPALPVAAQTRLDKKTIVRIGKNQKVNGHVCPACGTKNCKASVDQGGHSEFSCDKCGTQSTKDVLVNKDKPEDSVLRVAWTVFPDVDGCSSCKEKAKKLASRIKMEGRLQKAASEKDTFPMANCMERIARKYGGDTVASYGPCKGKPVADCVCKELQRLGFRTVRHMERLATASLEIDPMEQCMQEQKKKGLDVKQASSVCGCVKTKFIAEAKKKDPLLAEAVDNYYLSALMNDIKTGKEKVVTASELISLKEIDEEVTKQKLAQKVAAKEAELDEDIGKPLPVLVDLTNKEKKESMGSSMKIKRVATTPTKIETVEKDVEAGVPRQNQTLGQEGKDNIDVPMAKPSVPRGNAEMGQEGKDNINPAAGLPDVPTGDALIKGEKETQKGLPGTNTEIKGTVIAEVAAKDVITKESKTLKEVDTVENNADVPRGKATMGKEGPDNIDVKENKPDVPRGDATMGKEGPDNIDVKENKVDVPVGGGGMGHEKETVGTEVNDEYLKNVAAKQKRDVQLERIAQARFQEALKTASWLSSNGRIASDKETFDNVVKALSSFELGQIAKVAEQMFPGKTVKTASSTPEVKEASKTSHAIPAIVLESKQSGSDDLAKKLSSQFTIGNKNFDEKLTIYGEK